MECLEDIFYNSKVLITGHTGFKGSWLSLWLHKLGAKVYGISNKIPTNPSHFALASVPEIIKDIRLDIKNYIPVKNAISEIKPDFIFHLAAQPIVRESFENPLETWDANTIGTLNLLESLRQYSKNCIAIFITSDKVYDNQEWPWGYRESDKLGGPDPYSASKGAAELAISSYYRSYFKNKYDIRICSARAGNVIGGGDWARDRIVPDCIRSWELGNSVLLRNPNSTRPWQHVLEPLFGYLSLAAALRENIKINGESYNFGPQSEQNKKVIELVNSLGSFFSSSKIRIEKNEEIKESNLLKLNCDKALNDIGWSPTLNYKQTVQFTAYWYLNYFNSPKSIRQTSINQIEMFTDIFKKKLKL